MNAWAWSSRRLPTSVPCGNTSARSPPAPTTQAKGLLECGPIGTEPCRSAGGGAISYLPTGAVAAVACPRHDPRAKNYSRVVQLQPAQENDSHSRALLRWRRALAACPGGAAGARGRCGGWCAVGARRQQASLHWKLLRRGHLLRARLYKRAKWQHLPCAPCAPALGAARAIAGCDVSRDGRPRRFRVAARTTYDRAPRRRYNDERPRALHHSEQDQRRRHGKRGAASYHSEQEDAVGAHEAPDLLHQRQRAVSAVEHVKEADAVEALAFGRSRMERGTRAKRTVTKGLGS